MESPTAVNHETPVDAREGSTAAPGAPGPSGVAAPADPDRLQRLARRNLWMHFTRMGSYDEGTVPVIVRGEGATSTTSTASATSTAWPACSACNVGHGRTELAEAGAEQAASWPTSRSGPTPTRRAIELAARIAGYAPGRPQPRVLHHRRLGGGRVGLEARPASTSASSAQPPAHKVIAARSPTTAPRWARWRSPGSRRCETPVRAADARRPSRCRTPTSTGLVFADDEAPRPVGRRRDRAGDRASRGPRRSPP